MKLELVTARPQFGKGNTAREPNEACILAKKDGRHVALTYSGYARPTFPYHPDHDVAEDIILLQFDPAAHSIDPAYLFFNMTRMRTLGEVNEGAVSLYFTGAR
jgi:hypothetical protein